jgi:thiosulfate reductase cytochrome b subunit
MTAFFILLILIVTAINCGVLYALGWLMVHFGGGTEGMQTAWLVSGAWTVAFTLAALIFCVKGKRATALGIVALTVPAGWSVLGLGLMIVGTLFPPVRT